MLKPVPGRSLADQGLSLPPRRDQTISTPAAVESLAAVARPAPAEAKDIAFALSRMLRPQAAYRWLLPQLAAITPQYIEMTLRGALAGNHMQSWELFDLMQDTWPELSACVQELTLAVQGRTLRVDPYCDDGDEPSEDAVRRAKVVSAALRKMRPDISRDENDLNRTVADILSGWFLGQVVLEVLWSPAYEDETQLNVVSCGDCGEVIAPRGTSWVHPVCYAWDMSGRLGLRLEVGSPTNPPALSPGVWQSTAFQPRPTDVRAFPPHKFAIGLHKQKAGTVLGGSMFRVLAWWWCAANFSADWLLNLAQLFGLPFRFANYDQNAPQPTIDSICAMLENMGSAGWAAFPAGTTLELKDTGKTGDHSPQGELLDRADRYARMVILGQTLSGGQDASKGGGKAFGQVETDVKAQRVEAAAKYTCDVLGQIADSVLELNFGDRDCAPALCLKDDDYADGNEATRDLALIAGGLAVGEEFLYRKYNIPKPKAGEKTLGAAGGGAAFNPDTDIVAQRMLWRESLKEQAEAGDESAAQQLRDDEQMAAREADDENGRWITIHGNPVFIRDGMSVQDAIREHYAMRNRLAHRLNKPPASKAEENQPTPSEAKPEAEKKPENDSQKPPESDKLKESKDAGKAQSTHSPSKSERLVESAAQHVRGNSGAAPSHDEPTAARDQRAAAERARLYDWAESQDKLLENDRLKGDPEHLTRGGEHEVLLPQNEKGRVFKDTRPEIGYGGGIALNSDARGATTAEYLDRIQLANQEFHSDIKIVGVRRTGLGPSIRTSMPYVKGEPATPQQISEGMKSAGYRQVGEGKFYHDEKQILVHDLHPKNAIYREGKLYPIDPAIMRATREHAEFIGRSPGLQGRESKPDMEAEGVAHFAAALAADLAHVRSLVAGLNEITDDRILAQRALEVRDELEKLKADLLKLPKSAQALAEVQVAEFFNGLTNLAGRKAGKGKA